MTESLEFLISLILEMSIMISMPTVKCKYDNTREKRVRVISFKAIFRDTKFS